MRNLDRIRSFVNVGADDDETKYQDGFGVRDTFLDLLFGIVALLVVMVNLFLAVARFVFSLTQALYDVIAKILGKTMPGTAEETAKQEKVTGGPAK